jgi:hypothetical protein
MGGVDVFLEAIQVHPVRIPVGAFKSSPSHTHRCFIYLLPCRPQTSSSSGRDSRASNSDASVGGDYGSESLPSSSTYLDLAFQRMDFRALGALMSAGRFRFGWVLRPDARRG